jgi:aspartyl/asparaginyl-tRNA synthetase
MEMLKIGIPQTAGFVIGVERLTRYVCRLRSI